VRRRVCEVGIIENPVSSIEYPESSIDLCKTNPICYSNKKNTTFLLAKDYEQITMNNEPEKQTQSKPILSASGGFKPDLSKLAVARKNPCIFRMDLITYDYSKI